MKRSEEELEEAVSRYIGAMPFLFLGVEDELRPASERGFIERNAIALLSDYREASPDPQAKVLELRAALLAGTDGETGKSDYDLLAQISGVDSGGLRAR